MHYSSGFSFALSAAGVLSATGDRLPAVIARVLLDLAGLLFGGYLLAMTGLSLAGAVQRRRATGTTAAPVAGADRTATTAP